MRTADRLPSLWARLHGRTCCMASEGQHALARFDETGHAIMRSLEPGEDWRYCRVEWRQLDP